MTNRLLPILEAAHFRVAIDFRDFVTGAPGVAEMERCVRESRRLIVVLSKPYVVSEWSAFENTMMQTLDPAGVRRQIVPVIIEDCDVPLRLQIIQRRDLRNDDKVQWDLLLRDLV